jgi:hypothetical protein
VEAKTQELIEEITSTVEGIIESCAN